VARSIHRKLVGEGVTGGAGWTRLACAPCSAEGGKCSNLPLSTPAARSLKGLQPVGTIVYWPGAAAGGAGAEVVQEQCKGP
jgi:hypothetical protein